MTELYNNFTTPEQSKKLLELGVPAWSADCYYLWDETVPKWLNGYKSKRDTKTTLFEDEHIVPCGTTGRLMEIYKLCCDTDRFFECVPFGLTDVNLCELMVTSFENVMETVGMDYTKLED